MVEKYGASFYVTKYTVNHDDTSPLTLEAVKDGTGITGIVVEVTETWDDTNKAFYIGDSADPDGFLEDMGVTLETVGYWGWEHDERGTYLWHVAGSHRRTKFYTGAENIIATFVGAGNGGSQGQCVVYIIHKDLK